VSTETDRVRFLPPVAAEVLQGIGQHRLLTARQAQVLHLPDVSLRYTQRVLAELRRAGLIDRALAAHGTALWHPTPEGQALLRSTHRLDARAPRGALEQTAGASRADILALNETGIAFVKAARERGDECDAFSWQHEVVHPLTPARQGHKQQWLVADVLLSYTEDRDRSPVFHRRFIELDRAKTPAVQLAVKLGVYKLLHHCRSAVEQPGEPADLLWRAQYHAFPWVLVVLADQPPAAAQLRIKIATELWHCDPATRDLPAIPLHFVTLDQLTRQGPYAPIFTSANDPEQPQDWLGNNHRVPRALSPGL
jgi:hypothetical protein